MRAVISGVFRVALLPVAVLLPAGSATWGEGWAVVGLYVAYALGVGLWLSRSDPALLRERLKGSPVQSGQPVWDGVIQVGMMVAGIGMLIVPGLDVVRLGWTEPFPLAVKAVAMAVHVPCFLALGWVMHTNTFLARVVKIDEDRGHHVITTGPYAIVRHPMYAVVLPLLLAYPVALGSRWGLVPAVAMGLLLVVRTALEDRLLHRELPGYPEYAAKTRSRLVPGVW